MGLMSIFSRAQTVAPDTDFSDIPTEICVYQPDDEFAEPHMPAPVVPVIAGRTSEQGSKQ